MREEFTIPTDDGLAELHGDIMATDESSTKKGALLIVPGGWFAERDGFMGDSYTEADLMYLRLARRVRDHGFLVARYDNRGVSGNEFTLGLTQDSDNSLGDTARYLKACIDPTVRRRVTPESLVEDVASVFHYLFEHRKVPSSSIVVFAHSEGGIHVARAIGNRSIDPKGVVFAGTTMLSPVAHMKWQMVDRYVTEVMRWDRDGDARVSTADVKQAFETSFLADVGFSEQEIYPKHDRWLESELIAFFNDRYEQEKQQALAIADDAAYPAIEDPEQTFVAACYRWYKQWFIDQTPILDHLRDYRGDIALHYGEIDRQVSVDREVEFIRNDSCRLRCTPKIVVHPARGHALALAKPVSGPMDAESEALLTEEVTAMLLASVKAG